MSGRPSPICVCASPAVPANARARHPRSSTARARAPTAMPPTRVSTSDATSSAYTSAGAQYRITIDTAAPPQGNSRCGTSGTSSSRGPHDADFASWGGSRVLAVAGAEITIEAARVTAKMMRTVMLIVSGSGCDDDQDHDQQGDDDPEQVQSDRLPAGDLVVHQLGLRSDAIEIGAAQSGYRRVGPRNVDAERSGDTLHVGLLQCGLDRLLFRRDVRGSLGECIIDGTGRNNLLCSYRNGEYHVTQGHRDRLLERHTGRSEEHTSELQSP